MPANEKDLILYKQVLSNSEDETILIGKGLASAFKGGELIGIEGDLGSGKTVLVKGLASGLGLDYHWLVDSPTFKIINTYKGALTLQHVDLYRLETIEDIINIGLFDLLKPDCVVAVEWAEKLESLKVTYAFYITIMNVSNTARKIKIFSKGT